MSEPRDVGSGLQINQDLGFERREQLAQRVFWIVAAVALVACALGVFGGTGALSESQRAAADASFGVDYDRFARLRNPTSLDVSLTAGAGRRAVALASTWLEDYELRGVTPAPERVTALGDRLVFRFDVGAEGSVRFDLEPQAVGAHHATVWGPSGERVEFSQFVYP